MYKVFIILVKWSLLLLFLLLFHFILLQLEIIQDYVIMNSIANN